MDLDNIAAMMTTMTELMMTDEVWGEGSPCSFFFIFQCCLFSGAGFRDAGRVIPFL